MSWYCYIIAGIIDIPDIADISFIIFPIFRASLLRAGHNTFEAA
jgi:hypothetical protein